MRPVNAIMAGIAALCGLLIATGEVEPRALIVLLIVAIITAGGNVLNDVFDADIDAINRPDRPIPSGTLSQRQATWFAAALLLVGNLLCIFTTPLCILLALLNSVLLILYGSSMKRRPLIGNLTVSYLTGSVFLFGGALGGLYGLERNLTLTAMTLLATMARELLKAAEDVAGDRAGGVVSAPILIGIRNTSYLALGFAGAGVAVSLAFPWESSLYLPGIGLADLVVLLGAGVALPCIDGHCIRKSRATTILKAGMYVALAVFCVVAIV